MVARRLPRRLVRLQVFDRILQQSCSLYHRILCRISLQLLGTFKVRVVFPPRYPTDELNTWHLSEPTGGTFSPMDFAPAMQYPEAQGQVNFMVPFRPDAALQQAEQALLQVDTYGTVYNDPVATNPSAVMQGLDRFARWNEDAMRPSLSAHTWSQNETQRGNWTGYHPSAYDSHATLSTLQPPRHVSRFDAVDNQSLIHEQQGFFPPAPASSGSLQQSVVPVLHQYLESIAEESSAMKIESPAPPDVLQSPPPPPSDGHEQSVDVGASSEAIPALQKQDPGASYQRVLEPSRSVPPAPSRPISRAQRYSPYSDTSSTMRTHVDEARGTHSPAPQEAVQGMGGAVTIHSGLGTNAIRNPAPMVVYHDDEDITITVHVRGRRSGLRYQTTVWTQSVPLPAGNGVAENIPRNGKPDN